MKILGQFCLSKCTERYTCAFLVKCNFFPLRYCSHCSTALQNYFVFDMLPWHMKVNNDLLSQPSDKWRESIVNVQKHTAKPDKTRHKNDSRTTLFHCFKQFLLPLYYHYFYQSFSELKLFTCIMKQTFLTPVNQKCDNSLTCPHKQHSGPTTTSALAPSYALVCILLFMLVLNNLQWITSQGKFQDNTG